MIRLIISDCDGVLTDGRLYYGAHGEELKVFNVKDGTAIKTIISRGVDFGIISGRKSTALLRRSQDLNLKFCHMEVNDKGKLIRELRERYGLEKSEILFVGDDINDMSARDECGTLIAVADANTQLMQISDVVLKTKGGAGVFNEILNLIYDY